MAVLWYGLVPFVGAISRRYKWYAFRGRFNKLSLRPVLDYRSYWQQGKNGQAEPGTFRFVGGFESVTDGQTLWIRSDDLTVPVSLKNAETYLLPMQKDENVTELFDSGDDSPQRIKWERVSSLTEGARVFVGGLLACIDGRWSFVSTKEHPLIVIFFDGPDNALASMVIKAGRQRGEYWNSITPYSLILGAMFQIFMAVSFISRPAFRLTVIVAFIALFIPLYPVIPPGLLFTVACRRLAWKSRLLRIDADFALLPPGDGPLPGGQQHGLPAARRFLVGAYALEALAWLILVAGIGLNIFFLWMVMALL